MKKNLKPLSKELQMSFLGAVIEFMARVGASEREIRASFESGLDRARHFMNSYGTTRSNARYHADGNVSAYLLRVWCRDPRLIDSTSLTPRPLPLLRGKDNLRSLIASLDPDVDPLKVLNAMKAARLILRDARGRYLPAEDGAIVSSFHPWAVEHTAKSVIRLVSTVYRNANRSSGAPRLLERYSYVPDLDPKHVREFAAFSRMQGLTYLEAVDDWLEQRRVRSARNVAKPSSRGVAAGVHLITYLSEPAATMCAKPEAKRRRNQVRAARPTSPPSAPA